MAYHSPITRTESDTKVLITWEDTLGEFLARGQLKVLAVVSGLILAIDEYQTYMMS